MSSCGMAAKAARDGRFIGNIEEEGAGAGQFGGQAVGAGPVDIGDGDRAPAPASTRQVASPMPLAPPVTRALRPSRRKGVLIG